MRCIVFGYFRSLPPERRGMETLTYPARTLARASEYIGRAIADLLTFRCSTVSRALSQACFYSCKFGVIWEGLTLQSN